MKQEINCGTRFAFTDADVPFTIIYLTSDLYFALCRADDGELQIYATDSIEEFIRDGIAYMLPAKSNETITLTFKI